MQVTGEEPETHLASTSSPQTVPDDPNDHRTWPDSDGTEYWMEPPELPLAERYGPRRIRTALALFDTYKWRYGVDRLEDFLDVVKDAKVDPELIDCPTLILVAEQEYEEFGLSRRWQDQTLEQVNNERLIILPRDEVADSHSGGTNGSRGPGALRVRVRGPSPPGSPGGTMEDPDGLTTARGRT